jgi:D-hexose-6-phosphate mutarotase
MIEGMRRLNKQKDTRLPIAQGLFLKLINVLPYICSSIFEATLFSSAFSLAFHGFFRVGVIHIKDISIANANDVDKIELRIAFSKTDQHGHGSNIQIIQDRTSTCAVVLYSKPLEIDIVSLETRRIDNKGDQDDFVANRYTFSTTRPHMLRPCIHLLSIPKWILPLP